MANRLKRTPKAINAILSTLSDGLSIARACEAAGIARSTYFQWRQDDPDFAAKCEAAIDVGTDGLEDIARKRAAETSDTLLIFLLKARRPSLYRETVRQEIVGDAQHPVNVRLVRQ